MFFCAPANARPTLDQSIVRDRMCEEQSITSAASLPSAFRSGSAWNSTPWIVSLVQTWTYRAPGRTDQPAGSGIVKWPPSALLAMTLASQ